MFSFLILGRGGSHRSPGSPGQNLGKLNLQEKPTKTKKEKKSDDSRCLIRSVALNYELVNTISATKILSATKSKNETNKSKKVNFIKWGILTDKKILCKKKLKKP
jgi:hypothetical protein